mmetsp:Transcript_86623/g.245109  ORF Transcript_86623/g.245109 Transcript_86623/m.245109 type:complete len:285 (-) Transcript_86623:3464-4318(-)
MLRPCLSSTTSMAAPTGAPDRRLTPGEERGRCGGFFLRRPPGLMVTDSDCCMTPLPSPPAPPSSRSSGASNSRKHERQCLAAVCAASASLEIRAAGEAAVLLTTSRIESSSARSSFRRSSLRISSIDETPSLPTMFSRTARSSSATLATSSSYPPYCGWPSIASDTSDTSRIIPGLPPLATLPLATAPRSSLYCLSMTVAADRSRVCDSLNTLVVFSCSFASPSTASSKSCTSSCIATSCGPPSPPAPAPATAVAAPRVGELANEGPRPIPAACCCLCMICICC